MASGLAIGATAAGYTGGRRERISLIDDERPALR